MITRFSFFHKIEIFFIFLLEKCTIVVNKLFCYLKHLYDKNKSNNNKKN